MSELMSPPEVAERVGVTPDTARAWMASGRVPGAFRLGASYAIRKTSLDRWLESGTENGRGASGSGWLSSADAWGRMKAAGVRLSHVTLLGWMRRGVVPAQKAGRAWAVRERDLEAWLEGWRSRGGPQPKPGRPRKGEAGAG